MQKHFVIGSTDGQLIASMQRMMTKIYPTAFDTQYHHLNVIDYNLFAVPNSETIRHIDVTRPSDLRMKDSMPVNVDANSQKSNIRTYLKEVVVPFAESIERSALFSTSLDWRM